jgi:hypothetical protein
MPAVKVDNEKATGKPLNCGLVMPISSIDGCSAEHWSDVKTIITEAVESIKDPIFDVKLVSDADDVGVIQKRIVQNIYTADVIVCDVSGKNPNVMFELGMRLAFDKPTVIVKDDKTDYSFDTGIIEHVAYPRDLRFNRIVSFKSLLAEKVVATYKAAKLDPDHSTFLKNFGKFHVASLNQDVASPEKLALEMLTDLQSEVGRLRREIRTRTIDGEMIGTRSAEGLNRLVSEVRHFLNTHPNSDVEALSKDPAFSSQIEDACSAQRYFESPIAFRAALASVLHGLKPSNIDNVSKQ